MLAGLDGATCVGAVVVGSPGLGASVVVAGGGSGSGMRTGSANYSLLVWWVVVIRCHSGMIRSDPQWQPRCCGTQKALLRLSSAVIRSWWSVARSAISAIKVGLLGVQLRDIRGASPNEACSGVASMDLEEPLENDPEVR
jgi:hypothetical protein